ncbi:MAG TPA: MurT ligase domain-containing protein, partial [Tepidiformaceae bacterium]|nr:MurT ligase domain-containing protein [Tepidiformaceae bacterium]
GGGVRAEDMAPRLPDAGWPRGEAVAQERDAILDAILAGSAPGEDVFVVPTYTAMLDLRAELVARGAAQPFFETA